MAASFLRSVRASALVLTLLAGAAALGFLAGRETGEPSAVETDTHEDLPPPTVAIEQTDLTAYEAVRGVVSYTGVASLALAEVPAAPRSAAGVVTAVAPKLPLIEAGDLVLEISDRPVFALPGPYPATRSLVREDKGHDVRQLQEALQALGFFDGEIDGVLGSGTRRAVEALYRAAGYDPPKSSRYAPVLPLSEVWYFDSLPTEVIEVHVEEGSLVRPGDSILDYTNGELQIAAQVGPSAADRVELGSVVEVGPNAEQATVESVSLTVGTGDAEETPKHSLVAALPEDTALLPGNTAVVRMPIASVEGALVVPASALFESAGGTAVELLDGESRTEVAVKLLLESSGYAAIEALSQDLSAGDQVIIAPGLG